MSIFFTNRLERMKWRRERHFCVNNACKYRLALVAIDVEVNRLIRQVRVLSLTQHTTNLS